MNIIDLQKQNKPPINTDNADNASVKLAFIRAIRARWYIPAGILVAAVVIILSFILFRNSEPTAAAEWYNDDWHYRKQFDVFNASVTQALVDFQVPMATSTLALRTAWSAGKLKNDFSDLRFTDAYGNLLDFWYPDATSTMRDVYIKMPNVPQNATSTVFMYYGNPSAADERSGHKVFPEFFDDFSDGDYTGGPTVWTVSSGSHSIGGQSKYLQCNTAGFIKAASTLAYGVWELDFYKGADGNSLWDYPIVDRVGGWQASQGYYFNFGSTERIYLGVNNIGSDNPFTRTLESYKVINHWYRATITRRTDGQFTTYIDGELVVPDELTDNPATENTYTTSVYNLLDLDAGDRVDNILFRKFAATEPDVVTTAGTSEEVGGGPVGYWKFDEGFGAVAYDSSSYKNNGALTDMSTTGTSTAWIAGKVNRALQFDGINDYVNVGNVNQTVKSVSFWLKANNVSKDIIDFDAGTHSIEVTNGTLTATGFDSPTIYVDGAAKSKITVNEWHYITITTATGFTASALEIGTETSYFQGVLDEVKIYNYVLTAAQIKQGYNAGASVILSASEESIRNAQQGLVGYWPMDESTTAWDGVGDRVNDYSGNGNNGTAAGNAQATTTARYGNAGEFDGTGDYVIVPDDSSLNVDAITISAWVKSAVAGLYIVAKDPAPNSAVKTVAENSSADSKPARFSFINQVLAAARRLFGYAQKTGSKLLANISQPLTLNQNASLTPLNPQDYNLPESAKEITAKRTESIATFEISPGRYAAVSGTYDLKPPSDSFNHNPFTRFFKKISEILMPIVYALSSGPNSPGTMATSNASTGTQDWNTPDNAKVEDGSVTYAAVGSTSLCLAPDTLIATENGNKAIKDLKEGDLVYSYNFASDEIELKEINNLVSTSIKYADNKYYHIYFTDGNSIKATYNHLIYANNEWLMARDLKVGDELFSINGNKQFIKEIIIEENYINNVWSFSVNDNQNFFADGILVHNSGTYDHRVRIIKSDGNIGETDKAKGDAWTTTLTYNTYGASDDLWGEEWADTDINDSDFGVAISAYGSGYGINFTSYYLKATNFSFSIPGGSVIDGITVEIKKKYRGKAGGPAITYYADIDHIRITVAYSEAANTAPAAASVSDAPDPVMVGSNVTFSGEWTEADGSDEVRMYVCQDENCTNCDNSSQAGCWCYSSSNQVEPDVTDTCAYPAEAGDIGANSYWLGVCDDEPACDASPLSGGTFTVSSPKTDAPYALSTVGGGQFMLMDGGVTYSVTSTTDINDNEWHHITGTYDGSVMKIYIDGVLEGTNASYSGSLPKAAGNLHIGADYQAAAGNFFNGLIDEVKIYNLARTPDQITQDYLNGPEPIAYWDFEEGSGATANDKSGQGHNGTVTAGSGAWKKGKIGRAYDFDGANTKIDAGADWLGASALSVGAWIYLDSFGEGGVGRIIDNGKLQFYVNTTNSKLSFSSDASTVANSADSALAAGRWYYVLATRTNSGATNFYVNGIFSGAADQSSGAPIAGTTNVVIGNNNGQTAAFDGVIDHLKVYNYVLTPWQIAQEYNGGKPLAYWSFDTGYGTTANDLSGNGKSGTLTNMSTTGTSTAWQVGKFGKALLFDGSNDTVSVTDTTGSSLDVATHATLSAWIKPSNVTGSKYIIDKDQTTSYALMLNGSSLVGYFDIGGSNSCSGGTIKANEWQLVSATYDGSYIRCYINGRLVGQTADTGSVDVQNTALYIGSDGGAANYFNGLIDEVKIYHYALSPIDIREDYNNGLTVALGTADGGQAVQQGLVGYWPMDESTTAWDGVGDRVNDYSGNGNNGTAAGNAHATTTARYGNAGEFDGNGDYVSVTDAAASPLDLYSKGTLSAWIYPRSVTGSKYIIDKDQTTAYALMTSGSALYGYFGNSSCSGGALTINTWQYVSAVYDGDYIRCYINGSEVGKTAKTGSITAQDTAFYFGADNGDANFFNGLIDEVKIYNLARTPDQITQDYLNGPEPIASYDFEEGSGTILYDKSGHGYNGTITAGASNGFVKGKIGRAYDFDGAATRITVANNANLFPAAVSVSLFFRREASDHRQGLVIAHDTVVKGGYLLVIIEDDGGADDNLIMFQSGNGVTWNVEQLLSNVEIVNNQWYHLVVTADATARLMYLNNVPVASSYNGYALANNNNNPLVIGDHNTSFGTRVLNGQIDHLKIYNYVLTPRQIAQEYNGGQPSAHWKIDEGEGGTIYDWSGNGYHGTLSLSGSPATSTAWQLAASCKKGRCLDFDGTNDKITVADSANSGLDVSSQATLAAWIKPDSVTGSRYIIDKDQTAAYALMTSGDTLYGYFDIGGANSCSGGTIKTGEWQLVTATYNGNHIQCYINGRLVGQTADTGSIDVQDTALYIGADGGAANYFDGKIDEVKIWNYALSPIDIREEYNLGYGTYFK